MCRPAHGCAPATGGRGASLPRSAAQARPVNLDLALEDEALPEHLKSSLGIALSNCDEMAAVVENTLSVLRDHAPHPGALVGATAETTTGDKDPP